MGGRSLMIASGVLRAMLDAGATAEMIVAAVEADYAEERAKIEAKKAQSAERQRRYRHAMSRDVTQCHGDNADVTPKKETPHTPQEKYISNTRARNGTKPPPHPLPPDWKPSEELFAYGLGLNLSRAEVSGCAEEMRIWAESAAGPHTKKRNWDQAFQGWLRREAKKHRPKDRPISTISRGPWKPFKPEAPDPPRPSAEERERQVVSRLKSFPIPHRNSA